MLKLGSRAAAVASLAMITVGCASHGEKNEMKPAGGNPEIITQPATIPGDTMSDAQIEGILRTVNDGEIDASRLAKTLASAQAVRDFADMMVADHSNSNEKLTSIAENTGVMPADSKITTDMKNDHKKEMDKLRALNGANFDKAYMSAMISGHETVLKMLDDKLIPSAKNTELADFLREQRGRVATHLDHAKAVENAAIARR